MKSSSWVTFWGKNCVTKLSKVKVTLTHTRVPGHLGWYNGLQAILGKLQEWVRVSLGAPFIRYCPTSHVPFLYGYKQITEMNVFTIYVDGHLLIARLCARQSKTLKITWTWTYLYDYILRTWTYLYDYILSALSTTSLWCSQWYQSIHCNNLIYIYICVCVCVCVCKDET